MKNKLNDLPSIMEKGIYNEQKFTEESKNIVRNSIKKRNRSILPNFLTIAAACAFFGLGSFYIATETGLLQVGTTHTTDENKVSVVESPLDLNGDLPPDQPLLINDELINSLSVPLEIQSAVPSVSSKPIIFAKTTSEGYSVSLTFPGDGFEVNMIENVVPSESIEKYKETRTPIWSDEKKVKINGYDAFYSADQKEIHVFMSEKYFILHGIADEDQMLVLALMIDHNKPVQEMELKELDETDKPLSNTDLTRNYSDYSLNLSHEQKLDHYNQYLQIFEEVNTLYPGVSMKLIPISDFQPEDWTPPAVFRERAIDKAKWDSEAKKP